MAFWSGQMNCPIRVSKAERGSNVAYTLRCSDIMPYFFYCTDNSVHSKWITPLLLKLTICCGKNVCCFGENIKKKQAALNAIAAHCVFKINASFYFFAFFLFTFCFFFLLTFTAAWKWYFAFRDRTIVQNRYPGGDRRRKAEWNAKWKAEGDHGEGRCW